MSSGTNWASIQWPLVLGGLQGRETKHGSHKEEHDPSPSLTLGSACHAASRAMFQHKALPKRKGAKAVCNEASPKPTAYHQHKALSYEFCSWVVHLRDLFAFTLASPKAMTVLPEFKPPSWRPQGSRDPAFWSQAGHMVVLPQNRTVFLPPEARLANLA